MYCQNCGMQIDENALFCKQCGCAVSGNGQSGSGQNAGTQYQNQMQYQNNVQYQNNMPNQNSMPYQNNTPYGYNPNGAGMPYQGQKSAGKINIFALVASGVLAVAMFLPYVSFWGASASLIDGDGIFFLIAAALGVVGALVKKNIPVIIAGLAACVLSCIEIASFLNHEFSDVYTKGIGYYMMILGSVSLLISGFIKRK